MDPVFQKQVNLLLRLLPELVKDGRYALHGGTAIYCEVQTVPFNQLYGGKIVAALDRQHPRDIFDCWKLLESRYDPESLKEGFLFCLLSSKRPIHEILDPRLLDHRSTLLSQFKGMTDLDLPYELFDEVRDDVKHRMLNSFNLGDKTFLMSFAAGVPDWNVHNWSGYPGIMWKLMNLNLLKRAIRTSLMLTFIN